MIEERVEVEDKGENNAEEEMHGGKGSSPLCPLTSFTFTLRPAAVDLLAADGW